MSSLQEEEHKIKPADNRSVNFDNPDKLGWNATALPLYSGKILVSSSKGEQLSVPYNGMGLVTDRRMDANTNRHRSRSQSEDGDEGILPHWVSAFCLHDRRHSH